MSKKCVTHEECAKCNASLTDDLRTIKVALVGEDLRSGLVHEVSVLSLTLSGLIHRIDEDKACVQKSTDVKRDKDQKEKDTKRESSTRWKIMAFTTFAGFIGIILGEILSRL